MSDEKKSDISTNNQNVLTGDDSGLGEAVEAYGNVATAEELGYVQRGCVDAYTCPCQLIRHC